MQLDKISRLKYASKYVYSIVAVQPNSARPCVKHLDTLTKRYSSTIWYAGIWQSLSNCKPTSYMQNGLLELHDLTGLPWWGTIVLSTVLLRTMVTLPLTIYQHKITSRLEQISLEMPAIVEELKREASIAMRKFNWTEKETKIVYQRSLHKQWNKLIVRENCHPAKTFIVLWGQIPLWIFQSVALRNLVYMQPDPTSFDAKLTFTELTIGGFGWIPNLTELDTSYILPITLGIINLAIIEIQTILRTRPTTRLQWYTTNAFRGLSMLMIPLACSVPSAICLYWVSSSAYGLSQNLALSTPAIRRAFGIPPIKSEVSNPYERIWNALKMRTGNSEASMPSTTLKTETNPKGLEHNKSNSISEQKKS